MANRPAPFRQADISRALKGAKAAGFAVGRVEISTDGRIVILPLAATAIEDEPGNAWDEVLKNEQTPIS